MRLSQLPALFVLLLSVSGSPAPVAGPSVMHGGTMVAQEQRIET